MPTTGPVREMIKERKKQKQNVLNKLFELSHNKINLKIDN